MSIADLPSVMGAILILAGIALVLLQINTAMPPKPRLGGDFGPTRFKLQTEFPGLIMICIGAILLGVGAFARH
jgi:hypothetical protein